MPATKTRKKSSNKAIKESVYEIVTRRILDALDSGTIPWRNPVVFGGTMPTNLKSKKAYRGINIFLLSIEAMVCGYKSPYWLSYKQAEAMGGQVRKGEKSTLITFWKIDKKPDPNAPNGEKRFAILRYYRVFNVEQIDGLDGKIPADENPNGFTPHETCEAIMAGYKDGPEISEGSYFGNGAGCYFPLQDRINMPDRNRFKNETSFYSTLFHEATHSTGHGTRLNRDGWDKPNFGSEPYSAEELVAELGAAFLCGIAGIDNDQLIEDSAAYIDGWRKKLSDDPKVIVKAAGAAQKAADRILGTTFEDTTTESEDDNA